LAGIDSASSLTAATSSRAAVHGSEGVTVRRGADVAATRGRKVRAEHQYLRVGVPADHLHTCCGGLRGTVERRGRGRDEHLDGVVHDVADEDGLLPARFDDDVHVSRRMAMARFEAEIAGDLVISWDEI